MQSDFVVFTTLYRLLRDTGEARKCQVKRKLDAVPLPAPSLPYLTTTTVVPPILTCLDASPCAASKLDSANSISWQEHRGQQISPRES